MVERRFDSARLGADGEQRAASWYGERGYRILARNWRCPDGEIDLILASGSTVVICEVKTRANDRYGTPFDAVGPAKQRRLRRLAAQWLREEYRGGPVNVRFDVAGVVGGRVQVVQDAF